MLQIVTVDEAKQFYPLFGLGANVALIFSGRAVKYFSQVPAPAIAALALCSCQALDCGSPLPPHRLGRDARQADSVREVPA